MRLMASLAVMPAVILRRLSSSLTCSSRPRVKRVKWWQGLRGALTPHSVGQGRAQRGAGGGRLAGWRLGSGTQELCSTWQCQSSAVASSWVSSNNRHACVPHKASAYLRLAPPRLGVCLLLLRLHIGRRLVEDALKDAVRHGGPLTCCLLAEQQVGAAAAAAAAAASGRRVSCTRPLTQQMDVYSPDARCGGAQTGSKRSSRDRSG